MRGKLTDVGICDATLDVANAAMDTDDPESVAEYILLLDRNPKEVASRLRAYAESI